MIMSIIRKHSRIITALVLLSGLFAAPYLIPVNPDSAVFRSGTLGLMLIVMCAFPVKTALDKYDLRTLVCSSIFALVFCVCLGLGSELRVYNQLLPGFGSLIRRLAVPCMATPLIACLFSHLIAFNPQSKSTAAQPLPFIAFFLLFSTCYSAILLALYPGVISYDFQHEIKQFTEGVYQAAHPVFHTLFLGSLFKLGEMLFGTMTHGAALYSAVQLLLLAAMLAWACTFIQRRISSRFVVMLIALGFAFLPVHGVLAVSTSKDPLFSGLCTILCLLLWEIAENPAAFFGSTLRKLRFALCCLGISLLRHNGVFAYIPACIALLVLSCGTRKKAASVIVLSLALTLLIPKGLETLMQASETPSSEMMSIPCQQLMRTANYDKLPENEFRQIERWFPNATHTYRPNCADPAKGGNFNFAHFQEDPYDFWTTYAKYALKYPRIYLEAFLENCIGLWYPDDISHAHTLSTEENAYIYLNTSYPFAPDTYPIEPACKFPILQKLLYASTHHSKHQSIPLLSFAFCPAIYSFLLLLTTIYLIAHHEKRFALCLTPLWGIFVSILFSAGVLIRYAYPLMTVVPLMFVLAYFGRRNA